MNRFRRIIIIIALIVFVVLIFTVVWLLFFKPFFVAPPAANQNVNQAPTGGGLPNINTNRAPGSGNQPIAGGPSTLPSPSTVANGGQTLVNSINTSASMAATIGPDGKQILFYDDIAGKFMRIDPASGALQELSSQRFPDVENVTWSPDSTKAVLKFPDDRSIIYDFATSTQYSLPSGADEFSFSADSGQVAYEYAGNGPNDQILVTSNLDGSSVKSVARLADQGANVQVAWSPTSEVVAFFKKGADSGSQEIVMIGQNQENYKTIKTDGRGFTGKWTPDGSKLLYTVYSAATNFNPELHLVHARGQAIGEGDTPLGLQTFVEKCAFNSRGTFAYCAVPDTLERGSGLYPEFSATSSDTIYSINLTTGDTTPIAQPVTGTLDRYTVRNLVVSKDERELYFIDAATQRLQKLRLQ